MGYRAPPNCQHLDNFRQCRVLHGQNRIQHLFGLRPDCVLDQFEPPRDGEWTCDEQLPHARPPGPAPMPKAKHD